MTSSMTAVDTHPDHTADGQESYKIQNQKQSEPEGEREKESSPGPNLGREGPECKFLQRSPCTSQSEGEEIAVHKEQRLLLLSVGQRATKT